MKILWLSHLVPYPPKGGVLQRSYNLLREVARYHEVHLLSFVQKDLINAHFSSLEEGLKESNDALSEFCAYVEFVSIPCDGSRWGKQRLAFRSLFTKYPYTVNWLESDDYSQALKQLKEEQDFDLVHYDTISLAPYHAIFPNTPSVLDHHNIESHMMIRRAGIENNPAEKWYFHQEGNRLERYERSICPQFNLNITCSTLDSEQLRQIVSTARVDVVPNGVDLNYFHPLGKNELPNSIIFAGTLNWYPNQQAVAFIANEIWPRLKETTPGARADIVGAYPPASAVGLAKQDPDFHVHGFVDDVRVYLDRAAVYVCPITNGGGTKLKILDALAIGKAIVADPIACEGIDVTNGKDVVFASSIQEYITAIRDLLGNPERRRELGEAARNLVAEKYAYAIIGKKLSSLYASCLADNPQSSIESATERESQ